MRGNVAKKIKIKNKKNGRFVWKAKKNTHTLIPSQKKKHPLNMPGFPSIHSRIISPNVIFFTIPPIPNINENLIAGVVAGAVFASSSGIWKLPVPHRSADQWHLHQSPNLSGRTVHESPVWILQHLRSSLLAMLGDLLFQMQLGSVC